MLILMLVIVALTVLAVLTNASEISIIATSRLKLRRLAAAGSKQAKTALKILETPEKFFSTILITNNIVTTMIATIITVTMIALTGEEDKGVVIATVIASIIVIISEVAAKTYAAVNSEKVSLVLARPVMKVMTVFSPLVRIVVYITNGIVRALGGKVAVKPSLMVEEEVKALIKTIEEEGGAHKEKYRMMSKIFDFSDTVVRSVMTGRNEIVSINVDSSFDDILEKAVESGYSRIPVYRDNPDNIVGVINMKDLLNLSCNRSLVVLQDIIYPATFVDGSRKVTELLREFQKGHTHLAVVTGEQGRVEGIITLEDLLEEIVGEIEDEYDVRARGLKNPK